MYDLTDPRYSVSHYEASGYMDNIELFLRRDRDKLHKERGLMEYYNSGIVKDKVHSLFPTVEEHNGLLWCVAELTLNAPLTPEEMVELKDWWSGQLSDGWGESVEQREIKVDGGELYMEPWTSGDDFFIATQAEFAQHIGLDYLIPTQFEPAAENEVKPLMEAKLYSPVFCDMREYDEFTVSEDGEDVGEISQQEAAQYVDEIHKAILKERLPEEADRGLMIYFNKNEPFTQKVHSLFVDVEVHDSKLWAVAMLKVTEPLTPEEFGALHSELTGQYSDGFGEGFEQREIKIRDGEINVHLWKHGYEFFIDTQEQFAQRLGPDRFMLEKQGLLISENKINTGYLVTDADDSDYYFPNAVHIERDDSLMKYSNDTEAAKAAEIDGIKLIHGMKDVADGVYVDTPENRQVIIRSLEAGYTISNVTAPDLTGLLQRLRERAEQNWEDYRHAPHETTPDNLFHISMQVISRRDAYMFIKDYAEFTAEQLNCLLQFANPVELVADYLDKSSDISEMPGILANILEEQENFKNDYALMPEGKTTGFEERKQQLIDRLTDNYTVYKKDIFDLSKDKIFSAAAEILPVQEAYVYFTKEHDYLESDVDFLLKFENPLELISDEWSDRMPLTQTIDAIFIDQERTLQSSGYTLVSDDTAPTASKPERNAVTGANDKLSVIDRIRQAEKDTKRRGYTPKNKSNRNKSEEEI